MNLTSLKQQKNETNNNNLELHAKFDLKFFQDC